MVKLGDCKMDKSYISVQEYEKLVRASERLDIVTDYVKNNVVVCMSDLKVILGIKGKESEK